MLNSVSCDTRILGFWAKAARYGLEGYHPLLFHMTDVACVVQMLWQQSLSASTRRFIADSLGLPESAACRYIAYLSGLHDIGKASPGFQAKNAQLAEVLRDSGLPFPCGLEMSHAELTVPIVQDWLGQPPLSMPYELARQLAVALGGHHGRFPAPRKANPSELGRIPENTTGWDECRGAVLQAYSDLLGTALCITEAHPHIGPPFLLLFAGLTSVADWIASAEEFFPYEEANISPDDYLKIATRRAKNAVARLEWRHPAAGTAPVEFTELFPFDPRPLQQVTAEVASGLTSPGMVLIEAPMGEGKTEAALHLAESWLRRLGQQGCYVGLPTMATANAMFSRFYGDYLTKTHPYHASRLRLLHGQASISDDYLQLRKLRSIYDPDASGSVGTTAAEDWFSYRKRGLLSPFGVGTVDQALLSALQTKHGFVRLFGLAGKTVIIDEVHAFDVYTRTVLERLIQWLAAVGSSIILLSATLPKATRHSLIQAYAGSLPKESEAPYPRVTTVLDGRVSSKGVSGSTQGRLLWLQWLPDDDSCLVDRLISALADGGCAAFICNTVKRAQGFYCSARDRLVAAGVETILFHARYPFEERDAREKEVVARFGRQAARGGNRSRPFRSLVVATQVLEQSLDVDFDLMVTETAPVDLVLQRSGRLMRHRESHIPRYAFDPDNPELWLIDPPVDPNGLPSFGDSARVYSDYILLRSLLVLKSKGSHTAIPEDIEELIEAVYDDSYEPNVPDHMSERLDAARAEFQEKIGRLRREAKTALIKRPDFEGELCSIAGADLEEDNPDVHRAFQALTRWSDIPSVSVICLIGSEERVCLDAEMTQPVDLSAEPDEAAVRRLMRRSITLSGHKIAEHFTQDQVPPAWRTHGVLRHHRLALFRDGILYGEGFRLKLDTELGVVVEYDSNARKEEDE